MKFTFTANFFSHQNRGPHRHDSLNAWEVWTSEDALFAEVKVS